jgi:3-phosphoshikimate 1-carboxyvinyltransferase
VGDAPARLVSPVGGPLDASVRPPGSKSLTNRALVCAALAPGRSALPGALLADDTWAMVEALRALGATVEVDTSGTASGDTAGMTVTGPAFPGTGGAPGASSEPVVELDARLSGTTSRFLLALVALGPGRYRLDGAPSLRARPMADGIAALRSLGAEVTEEGAPGHLPVVVRGAAGAEPLGVEVAGGASSQFLTGLLLTGPAWPAGLHVTAPGPLVSRPYVDMTVAVMRAFGARVTAVADGWVVEPGGYRPTDYRIEPDASAASYFFAAAAICGGRVTVEGLARGALQGDVAFVDVLERMGCRVSRTDRATTVEATGPLDGVDVDMADISDTAQTLAAVAVFARTPTRVRGIGFIRAKETDRVGNVVRELRRCGVDAREEPDGFVIHPATPGTPRPARIETYDDHRMAMSFALLGLRAPGIEIADPGCVSKTFPGFWDALEALRPTPSAGAGAAPG